MLQDPLPSPLREDAAKWLGFRLAVSLKSRTLNKRLFNRGLVADRAN